MKRKLFKELVAGIREAGEIRRTLQDLHQAELAEGTRYFWANAETWNKLEGNPMRFSELEKLVVDWHNSKDLIEESTDRIQTRKLAEEVDELTIDVLLNTNRAEADKIDLRDELGDCLVVLVNIAARNGFTLQDALEFSYGKIRDRKGRTVDGVFVKDNGGET